MLLLVKLSSIFYLFFGYLIKIFLLINILTGFFSLDITEYGLAKIVGEYLHSERAASDILSALENAEI